MRLIPINPRTYLKLNDKIYNLKSVANNLNVEGHYGIRFRIIRTESKIIATIKQQCMCMCA